jgi:hypothetical protein
MWVVNLIHIFLLFIIFIKHFFCASFPVFDYIVRIQTLSRNTGVNLIYCGFFAVHRMYSDLVFSDLDLLVLSVQMYSRWCGPIPLARSPSIRTSSCSSSVISRSIPRTTTDPAPGNSASSTAAAPARYLVNLQ